MTLGYQGSLYILAFDHRGSFKKAVLGHKGETTGEELDRVRDAKQLIFEGVQAAAAGGAQESALGVLCDEEFGGDVPRLARAGGMKLAMPVEKSGQAEFDFEYGEDFGAHIESFDVDFAKVLVRYNPDGDAELNARQTERLQRLSEWLHEHGRKFLFELLVPAEDDQLTSVGGDEQRYETELRPELMRRSIAELHQGGVEPDVWKIEGVDDRSDCQKLADECRTGGRENVACIVLGRGADDAKVDQWLRQAAPVEGYIGFAIGRSIWSGPLADYLHGSLDRSKAAKQIGDNYLRFVSVYTEAA